MPPEIAPIYSLMRHRRNSFFDFPPFGTQVNGTQTEVFYHDRLKPQPHSRSGPLDLLALCKVEK